MELQKKIGNYLIGKEIGHGSIGKVKTGLHILLHEKVSVRVIAKSTSGIARMDRLRQACMIQRHLQHPNIVRLFEIIETKRNYYAVEELAEAGPFGRYLAWKEYLGEEEASRYISQIISAVVYMHQSRVVHGQLRLGNLLLDRTMNIKIKGFVNSRYYFGSPVNKLIGSMPKNKDDESTPVYDIQQILFLTYTMLSRNIVKENPGDDTPAVRDLMLESMSEDCKDFLRDLYLCTRDSEPSLKLEELLSHKWFSKHSITIPQNHVSIGIQSWHNLQHDIIRRAARIGGCREKEITTAVLENSLNSAAALYHILRKTIEKARGIRKIENRPTTQSNDNGNTSKIAHRRICYSKGTFGSLRKKSTLQRKVYLPRLLGNVSCSTQYLVPVILKPITQESEKEEQKSSQESSAQNSIINAKYMAGGVKKSIKTTRRDNPETSKDETILDRQDQKVFIHMWNGIIPPKTPPRAPPNSASHGVQQSQNNEERNVQVKQPRLGHWRASFKKKQALKSLTTNGKKILRYRNL